MKIKRINLVRVLLLWSVVLWSGPAVPVAGAEDEARLPDITRSDAYRLLRRGDELRERRAWPEAAHAYYSALNTYQLLEKSAPAWEQDYYRFRIGYCERELAMIVRATGISVDEWLTEQPVDLPVETDEYRARFYALQEENRYLSNRLDELEDELELYREMEEIEQDRELQRMMRPEPTAQPQSEPVERMLPEPPEPIPSEPRVIFVIPERVQDPALERPIPRCEEPRRFRLDEPVPLR